MTFPFLEVDGLFQDVHLLGREHFWQMFAYLR
jgi:hypothetical protein